MTDRPPLLAGVRVIESSMLGPGRHHHPPRRPRRRRHQGRAAAGRLRPPDDVADRRGRRRCCTCTSTGASAVVVLDLQDRRGGGDLPRPRAGRRRRGRGDAARRPGQAAASATTTCKTVNPKIVFCTISGYGMTGPYQDLPSHGIAYDTWAGLVTARGRRRRLHPHPRASHIGINAGPLFGALGILAGIIRARATGEGCRLEIAQSDAAAAMDWYRSETWQAYERPEDEVTGNAADDYERRAPGTAGMREGVRYQIYESADGHVLFMASEQEFWKNFCEGVGRTRPVRALARLEVRRPRPRQPRAAGRAQGDLPDQDLGRVAGLRRRRTTPPIAPVNTPKTIADDPQFQDRFPGSTASSGSAPSSSPSPLKLVGEDLPVPTKAPDGRPAHRRGPPRRPRLRRRPHRRAA